MSEPGSQGKPFVLGLTGSIGMGKSTTAAFFVKHGVPVHESDAAVHALYDKPGLAAQRIADSFPGSAREDGTIDRARLRTIVMNDSDELKRLERLVHPLVQAESDAFVERHAELPIVVLDIPLLFETGAEKRCDAVLVVTAPTEVQKARVLARDGMSEAVLESLLSKQMPDTEKHRRADFVIDTGLGLDHAEVEVSRLIEWITHRR